LCIELNPNYATGHHWYADWLLYTGRIEAAFLEISRAVELDPISQGILKDKGMHFYYTRQYDKALDIGIMTLELDPGFVPAYRLLSLAYQGKGMFDEAIRENERWGNGTGNKLKTEITLAQLYAVAGRKEEARQIIANTDMGKCLGGNDHRSMALVHASLGDRDRAFEWLEKSYRMHEESLCSMKIDPKMDPLRSDPRFDTLLKKIGLEIDQAK
jgi:tetratricopeptide (TPR) repeat protein